jgi:ATP-dependent DNA helicase PIF1
MSFTLKQCQFPIQEDFAMTINMAQGQTFRKIGLYMPKPVFTHGQLYVAFFRVRKLSNIKVKVKNKSSRKTEGSSRNFYTEYHLPRTIIK